MKRFSALAALAAAMVLPAAGAELTPADDIQKALDAAAPGDTSELQDGVYYQRLTIARGGTPGNPLKPWQGPEELDAKVYLGWDSEALCVAAEVTDDRHFNTKSGKDLLNGDALQIGLDTPTGSLKIRA